MSKYGGDKVLKNFNPNEFEDYVSELKEKTGVPGIGVGISIGDNLEYFKGFGVSDVEKRQPITPDTVFGLA